MLMLMLTMLEMGFSVRSFSLPATTHCLGLSLTHNGGKELWLGDGIKDNRFVPTPVFSPSRVLLPLKESLWGWMQNFWLVNSRLAHSAFSIAGRLHFFLLLCWPSILPAPSSLFIHLASSNATRLSIVYFVSFYFYAYLSFTFFFEELTETLSKPWAYPKTEKEKMYDHFLFAPQLTHWKRLWAFKPPRFDRTLGQYLYMYWFN